MSAEVMSAEASGNTIASAFISRSFQFTLNQPEKYNELKNILTSLKSLNYLISCEEIAPTTNHKHMHIYVHFNRSYKLNKRILAIGAHVEKCKGSPQQNIAYIEKNGKIIDEIGERPRQGAKTFKEIHEMKIEDVDPHLYRIKKDIDEDYNKEDMFNNMLSEIENNELKAPKVYYYTGDTGCGKTYNAYKDAIKEYGKENVGKITIENNFLSIIRPNAKCFVIEEFRPSQMKGANFLQMIDKYGYDAPIKGGHKMIRPEAFYICSIISPHNIYKDELNGQFLRRITYVRSVNENHEIDEHKPNLIDIDDL
nr:replication associated protein [Banfec virus 1]